jgi:hypothetical protein
MMWNSSTPASDTSSPPVTTSTAMASKPATKNSDTR